MLYLFKLMYIMKGNDTNWLQLVWTARRSRACRARSAAVACLSTNSDEICFLPLGKLLPFSLTSVPNARTNVTPPNETLHTAFWVAAPHENRGRLNEEPRPAS